MRRTTFLPAAFVAAVTLCVGIAQADQGDGAAVPQRLDAAFEQIDLDASGTLTVAEMRAAAAARFNALDMDGDGRVTTSERGESRNNRLATRFRRADRDRSGTLDVAEIEAVARLRAHRRLARLDTDGDGMLSLEELQAAPLKPDAGAIRANGAMTLADLDARMMALFTRADADGDGVVTAREARR